MLNGLSPESAKGHLTIIKTFPVSPPILVDDKQLELAFFNNIKNAMETLPDCGNIFIGSKLNATQLILEFVDNGSRITEENILKIANPYFFTKNTVMGLDL
jgi:signal transduction histidine kinase